MAAAQDAPLSPVYAFPDAAMEWRSQPVDPVEYLEDVPLMVGGGEVGRLVEATVRAEVEYCRDVGFLALHLSGPVGGDLLAVSLPFGPAHLPIVAAIFVNVAVTQEGPLVTARLVRVDRETGEEEHFDSVEMPDVDGAFSARLKAIYQAHPATKLKQLTLAEARDAGRVEVEGETAEQILAAQASPVPYRAAETYGEPGVEPEEDAVAAQKVAALAPDDIGEIDVEAQVEVPVFPPPPPHPAFRRPRVVPRRRVSIAAPLPASNGDPAADEPAEALSKSLPVPSPLRLGIRRPAPPPAAGDCTQCKKLRIELGKASDNLGKARGDLAQSRAAFDHAEGVATNALRERNAAVSEKEDVERQREQLMREKNSLQFDLDEEKERVEALRAEMAAAGLAVPAAPAAAAAPAEIQRPEPANAEEQLAALRTENNHLIIQLGIQRGMRDDLNAALAQVRADLTVAQAAVAAAAAVPPPAPPQPAPLPVAAPAAAPAIPAALAAQVAATKTRMGAYLLDGNGLQTKLGGAGDATISKEWHSIAVTMALRLKSLRNGVEIGLPRITNEVLADPTQHNEVQEYLEICEEIADSYEELLAMAEEYGRAVLASVRPNRQHVRWSQRRFGDKYEAFKARAKADLPDMRYWLDAGRALPSGI